MPQKSIANAEIDHREAGLCPAQTPQHCPPSAYAHACCSYFLFSPCTQALELASQPIAVRVGQSLVTCAGIAGTSCHLRRGVGTLVLMLSML